MPVVQIRLFGWKAEGSLARPFKVPNPFADLMGQATGTDSGDSNDDSTKSKLLEESSNEVKSETESPITKGSGVKSRKARKEE